MSPNPSFSESFATIPEELLLKVNGSTSESLFRWLGKLIADVMEAEIDGYSDKRDILDFGCGLGRVLLQLGMRAPHAKLVGFDVDANMLKFAARLLDTPAIRWVSEIRSAPDASFDFIFAISVFTHLSATSEQWLAEIRRLLHPDGIAFITYLDETVFEEMAKSGSFPHLPPNFELKDRFVTGVDAEEGGAGMGTYYRTETWSDLIGRYFEIVTNVPRGLFGHQSYTVVRLKGRPRSTAEELASTVRRAARYRLMAVRELQSTIGYYKGRVESLEAELAAKERELGRLRPVAP